MKTDLKGVGEEIDKIEWKSLCEEDYTNLPKRIKPRIVYWDTDGNVYHFVRDDKKFVQKKRMEANE